MTTESIALSSLTDTTRAYYAGGAGEEVTLSLNKAVFSSIGILPRVLVPVGSVSLETSLFGARRQSPLVMAPMAFQGLAHPEAEAASARGCLACRPAVAMCLSTLSTLAVEDVAAVGGELWAQVYIMRDRRVTERQLARAVGAGVEVFVLTVDAPVLGVRDRDSRFVVAKTDVAKPGGSLTGLFASEIDPDLDWTAIRWLREALPPRCKILLKGVLHPTDALLAVRAGADGLVVSNHGGRQLDTVPTAAQALPAIARAVREVAGPDRFAILADGGVRRGTDVFKLLALGAQAVMIGRTALWGLAAGGKDGVEKVLQGLTNELTNAMALAGTQSIKDIKEASLITLLPPKLY
jgi:4-hydroxymandelate oxidase